MKTRPVSEVGVLIRKEKLTTNEIRQRLEGIPDVITLEYLMEIGYKKSTAQYYLSLLKKNEGDRVEDNIRTKPKYDEIQNKDNSAKVSKDDFTETYTENGRFYISENANFDNILLDTSALNSQDTIDVIEKSNRVTVLLATVNEINRLMKPSNLKLDKKKLIYNINKYCLKMLEDNNKFILVPFKENKDEADAIDNALLNYLEIQPSKIRQTLITADKNLALRAKCLGFDFIYFHPNEENSKTKNKNNNKSNSDDIKTIQSKTNQANQTDHADQADKKQDNKKAEIKSHLFLKDAGVIVSRNNKNICIRNNNQKKYIFYYSEGKCLEIVGNKDILEEKLDYIVIVSRLKSRRGVSILKMVKEKNYEPEQFECEVVNQIYKLENILDSKITDRAATIFF